MITGGDAVDSDTQSISVFTGKGGTGRSVFVLDSKLVDLIVNVQTDHLEGGQCTAHTHTDTHTETRTHNHLHAAWVKHKVMITSFLFQTVGSLNQNGWLVAVNK